MKLNLMESVLDQKQALAERRLQKAKESYQFALGCLREAKANGFRDKTLLSRACDALFLAIQTNRTDPEPLVSLAYLMLLVQENKRAMTYLKRALELAPGHADAQKLLDYLVAGPAPAPAQTALAPELPLWPDEGPQDYDLLYEQCEQVMMGQFKQLMSKPQPQLALSQEALQELVTGVQQLESILEQIQRQLRVIDQEIEISELKYKLKPLNTYQQRQSRLLADSRIALQLLENISQDRRQVLAALRPVNPSRLAGPDIDGLLDRCDRYADQIDAFENQAYAIAPLVSAYEEMVALLQEYQDQEG